MTFNQLFIPSSPEEISDNVFKMVGKDFFVITAGNEVHYNSMVGSGGGLGVLFAKLSKSRWQLFFHHLP